MVYIMKCLLAQAMFLARRSSAVGPISSGACADPIQGADSTDNDAVAMMQLRAGAYATSMAFQAVCNQPWVLCSTAQCSVESGVGYCNCSYMGKGTSITPHRSSEVPAPFTQKPYTHVCDYMAELPLHGAALSTYSPAFLEPSWPHPASKTCAGFHCTSENSTVV